MATKVVEVRECDRCGREPAHTWLITGPEGATREIELCDRHAAPVANAFALGRSASDRSRGRGRRRARASDQSTPAPTASGPAGSASGPAGVAPGPAGAAPRPAGAASNGHRSESVLPPAPPGPIWR